MTTGFSLWGFWAREGREANRCNCRWIGWIVLTTYGIIWDCQEIVLHWIIEASCICCKEIVKVRYKIIWVVASGCRVSGYLNSCYIWILRVFGGFSDLFPLTSYSIYYFHFTLKNEPRTTDQSFLNLHEASSLPWLVWWSFTLPCVWVQHHKSFTGVTTSWLQPASELLRCWARNQMI